MAITYVAYLSVAILKKLMMDQCSGDGIDSPQDGTDLPNKNEK